MTSHLLWACVSLLFIGAEIAAQGQWCNLKIGDCGSVKGKLLSATYNGTCQNGVALLKKGTVAGIDFNFKATSSEAKLTSKVEGKIGALPYVNFPLDNPNACVNSNLSCPIPANTPEDYKPALKVLTIYPSVNVDVKWQLQNQNGEDVFCAILFATIVSS